MLAHDRLLDLVENFILFDTSKPGATRKVIARNHQVLGVNNAVASVSYVTGTHSLKAGFSDTWSTTESSTNSNTSNLYYRFNGGTPNQLTMYAYPSISWSDTTTQAAYVDDKWTFGRLTLQGGMRYEHAWSWFPEGENGIVEDNQFGTKFLFPRTDGVTGYHDITPRMGAAWDVFGTGRTSVKVNVSKYLQASAPSATPRASPTRSRERGPTGTAIQRGLQFLEPAAAGSAHERGRLRGVVEPQPACRHRSRSSTRTRASWGIAPTTGNSRPASSTSAACAARGGGRRLLRRWFGNPAPRICSRTIDFSPHSFIAPVNPQLPDGGGFVVTDRTT
jgi:hypothetical protein